ncbi:helix-turn-helix transcriptional regulator [Paraburkholderia phymatum]|uniref:Transcriptional regulator, AraC family n=1 Tax=Paraburkholderia phymatum (strain DSM 17167 / CIP 108236 / LMG 21445 / STM815) TaxID=391038 RepID=B2JUG1_PARP8|nr:helix-turn-helix transcriptional regulator [Paraburkholderia phymatum]ACC74683.1 transcriptional regulator, AraC family [Paraburkholderia phymatum STM815]
MDHCATTFDVRCLPQDAIGAAWTPAYASRYLATPGLSGLQHDTAGSEPRAVMVDQVLRYVQAHLCDDELSPESVLSALQLPRSTLYRLFRREGGLGAYIRHLRLRHAADDLVRYPHALVVDIAFGLGFKSASVFTRAFRRVYGMAPQEYRALGGEGHAAMPSSMAPAQQPA